MAEDVIGMIMLPVNYFSDMIALVQAIYS